MQKKAMILYVVRFGYTCGILSFQLYVTRTGCFSRFRFPNTFLSDTNFESDTKGEQ